MIVAIALTFIFSVFVFLQLKLKVNCKGKLIEHENKLLKSPPSFSMYVAIVWFLTIGNVRLINFLLHLRSRFQIAQARFLNLRGLVINDLKLGRDAFNKSTFSGRPTSEFFSCHAKGSNGLMFTHGEQWKEHRRFSHQHLKEFGFNTRSMELYTHNEIDDLIKSWCDKKGEPFSPNKEFYIPTLSNIWVVLAGERASAQNQQLVQLVGSMFEALSKGIEFPEVLLIALPMERILLNRITTWIPIFPGIPKFLKSVEKLHSFLEGVIKTKKEELDVNGCPRDLMEAYLKKIQTTTDSKSGFYGDKGELNLLAVASEFFLAGGDTTASTLTWCMLHLIRNPDVQEKIRTEIETAVGGNRRTLLIDRPNCPYTQSFIWEVLRYSPFAAVGLPHETTEDTCVGSYFVKKGTIVFLNIYGIHHDPEIWGDPENFRPERFLSPDGKTFIKHDSLCVFSIGQRRCPGEQLALDNLFLFISSICQRFVLKPDPLLKGFPEVCERRSLFHVPDKFYMIAEDRV